MDDIWRKFLHCFSIALGCLCLLQIAAWLPTYLTRPWYADHDVFATMAQSWDAGILPYRDLISNNFPGTIYLFWCIGKVFGWGAVRAFYGFDAALLLTLVAMTTYWSRVRFGRILPAVVGLLAVNSYYLGLDFSMTAQRDWQAPLFVVLGLMAAQTWPNRVGKWLAALGFTAAILIRPQVVLILPAMLLAVTEPERLSGATWSRTLRAAAAWLAIVALVGFLGLLPLLRDGLVDDFLNGLRVVTYGGSYNKKTLRMIASGLAGELGTPRISMVIVALTLLAGSAGGGPVRSLARTWLAALTGMLLYAPLSPADHSYLFHGLWLVWSINLAVLVALILEAEIPSKARFLGVLLVLGLITTALPRYSLPSQLRKSLTALREGREVRNPPAGYSHPYGKALILPEWEDYQAVLGYLRARTSPETRVANLLIGVAVNGPAGRLSSLPAESATWLFMVKRDDEARFARALEDCPDSVVVMWSPGKAINPEHIFPMLEEVVHRLYVPEARFGSLEVWRRRPAEVSSSRPRPLVTHHPDPPGP